MLGFLSLAWDFAGSFFKGIYARTQSVGNQNDGVQKEWLCHGFAQIASVYCTFGEGAWEWREDWKGERWYWGGDYYTAPAWKGTFSLQEADNQSIVSTMELREFEGTFPLDEDGSTEEHKASGKITGKLKTEHCEKLNKTAWF